jgi:hypothetical protein
LRQARLIQANLQGAHLEQAVVSGVNFEGADLRAIPWLLIMELTLQPGTNFTKIRWDDVADE